MEIWNKATGGDRADVRVVVYRCKTCQHLHVGRQRRRAKESRPVTRPQLRKSYRPSGADALLGKTEDVAKNHDIRYLIEEFDIN